MDQDENETKANLDPIPAVDPGLPKLADKYAPVPPILAEPVDDAEQEGLEAATIGEQNYQVQLTAEIHLARHVLSFTKNKSEKGKTLTDLMVELSHDQAFNDLLAKAR